MKKILIALAATAAFAAPSSATIVFSDNFDAENGGATALNYIAFSNFASTGGGFVDLVSNSNPYGIQCAGNTGSCVDLDGSPGPGEIRSIASFSFNAGDKVRLSYDLSGNQRVGGPDDWYSGFAFGGTTALNNYGFNYFGSDIVVGNFNTPGISTSTGFTLGNAFSTKSLFFTAGSAGSLKFFIGSASVDNIGPVVDNVSLSISAVPEPASWAMMLSGIGLAGAAIRRRTKLRYVTA